MSPEEVRRARWPTDPKPDPDVAMCSSRTSSGGCAAARRPASRTTGPVSPSTRDRRKACSANKTSYTRREAQISTAASSAAGRGGKLFGFRLCHGFGRGRCSRASSSRSRPTWRGVRFVLKVSDTGGKRAADPGAVTAHAHRADLSGPRGRGPGRGLYAHALLAGQPVLRPEIPPRDAERSDYRRRTGRVLEAVQAPDLGSPPPPGAVRRAGFRRENPGPVKRVLRPGGRLTTARPAEGLQHSGSTAAASCTAIAKPSNVLPASEGQPVLLDFNLSQGR